jgi:hypothetical protein|tara:strand:- start:172 stop:417 length:246 start_codon:yes stop_codon:yes gene_type:complete
MANNTLLLGGVVVIGLWWWKKNNGHGFSPVMASTEMTGNPSGYSLSDIQKSNWIAKWRESTPPDTLYRGVVQIGPGGRLSL